MASNGDYINTPGFVRVFFEDTHWSIDGADSRGGYTEEIWDVYGGERMTRDKAVAVAPEFAAEHGWNDLPIKVQITEDDGTFVVLAS